MTGFPPQPNTIEKLQWAVWPSIAMLAGMQLDIFTPLKDGPRNAEQVADAIGVSPTKIEPLLYTLVAGGLLTVEGNFFSNTEEANYFLVRGKPSYLGGRHELILQDWRAGLKTAESIRTGSPQAKRDFANMSKEQLEAVFRGSYPGALQRGRELVAMSDFSPHHSLIDIGGGSGGLAIAVTESCPHIRATVVDLPPVTPIAQRFVDEAGAAERVQVMAADIVSNAPMGSFDVAVLSSFIQVLSPDQARRALKNVHKVMNPGGVIYIRGYVLDNSRTSPPDIVMRNLFFLNVFDHGQAYTEQEHRNWLTEASFEGFERAALPDGFSLVMARKPDPAREAVKTN